MAEFRLIPAILAAIALAIPGAVKAFPAAPLEADTRPCFELLPDPAISRHCFHHYRYYGRGGYHDGWGYRIACDRAGPRTLQWALDRVPPGGVLFLIGGVHACRGTLDIRKSVTIVGQPGWQGSARVPTLEPDEGQPCIRIRPQVEQVTLVGLLIQSRHGDKSSCIEQFNRELTLDGTWIRYDGDASAIDTTNGRLILRRSVIAGRTQAAAVYLHAGGLEVESSSVLATTIGVRAKATEDMRIRGLNLERLDDWTGTERVKASVGIGLDSAGTGRLVDIQNSIVEGFSRGVYADPGQEVAIQSLIVRDSEYGVLSAGARLRINGSEIEAIDAGVYAAAGEAWATGNRIIGVRRAGVYVEKGAHLKARDNIVFADKDGCQALAVEGLDPDSQSCRPWFEAPEFYRTGRASGRAAFDDVWPDTQGALTVQSGPGF
jgi:Right handed beta helix region